MRRNAAAALALERAERPLRGARYKVPRFVRQDMELGGVRLRRGDQRTSDAIVRMVSAVVPRWNAFLRASSVLPSDGVPA